MTMSRGRLPRPVVRDRPAQGDDGGVRDHRHVPGHPLARHGVRAAPPLHGRDRRRVPRLGHPEGRHRRRVSMAIARAARDARRGDPDRGAGRPDHRRATAARPASRSRAARRSRRPIVLSSADAKVTFLDLLEPGTLEPDVRGRRSAGSSSAARRARSTSPSTGCPTSPACPATASTSAARSRSRRRSTRWSGPTTTRSTAAGAARPYIDMIIPTLVDPPMAPPGKHVISCFVQYAPYQLARASGPGTTTARRSATR